jgi:hypothetical protein
VISPGQTLIDLVERGSVQRMPVVRRWWCEPTDTHGRRHIRLRHDAGPGWTVETEEGGEIRRVKHFATQPEALAWVESVIDWTGDLWHLNR